MKIRNDELHSILRFTFPVAVENLFTQIIALIVPMLIGGISGSALAAVGLVNQTVSMYTAVFAMMSTGGAVLLARSIGAKDWKESSLIAEQNILLTLVVSMVLSGISLVLAAPIMRLLMVNPEENVLREGVVYFRLMLISFPALMLQTVGSAMLRSAGDSKNPMLATVVLNLVQVAMAALLIKGLDAGIAGAGLSYVIARYAGAALVCVMLLLCRGYFRIDVRRLFKPHFPTWLRMVRIGVPNSFESTLVQAGYLIANSMIMGVGTHQATVYQVVNTLYGFASYPQVICGPILISFVGQHLGAGDVKGAKKTLLGIYSVGMTVSLLLSLVISLCVAPLSALYSQDALVLADCRTTIWYMFFMCIPAMSINGMDPGLKAGGDSKAIMIYTVLSVWLVRVPLTWLFCYKLSMGVGGLFLANIASLVVRALCSQVRFHTGRWLHRTI